MSDVEAVVSDESSSLLGSDVHRRHRIASWWAWLKSHLSLSVLKLVLLGSCFLVAVVLFARFGEPDVPNGMHAVVAGQPVVLPLSPFVSYVDVRMSCQTPETSMIGSWLVLQVSSGRICPLNMSFNPSCSLVIPLSSSSVSSVNDLFGLDRSASSSLIVWTNSSVPIAASVHVEELSDVAGYQVVIAAIVLVAVYAAIILELVHRTLAAMFGAFAALAVLGNIRGRPSFDEVMTWIDWETCGLLFGMMVMVGIFSTTGFFEYAAVRMYKLSGGKLWRLVSLLCLFTAFVSAFLDNVTTILLVAPVTMQLCHVLDVDPVPVVTSLVLFSNIGGTATAIGDPPNILLVSDSRINSHVSNAINFGTMTLHLFPGALLCVVATYFIVRLQFHARVDRNPNQAREHELQIWKRTVARIAGSSTEEVEVRQQLMRHIATLEKAIQEGYGDRSGEVDLEELERKYVIRDVRLLVLSSIVLGCVIVLFFLHSFVEIHLTLAWISIIGAMAMLLLAGVKDMDEVLQHLEWSTLMFFAALFVLMEALDKLGLIQFIGVQVTELIATVPEGGSNRLAAAVTVIVWVSGIASSFIDNIPFTTAMIPVIVALASPPLSLPLGPLVWALAFGACLGGNGTVVGASANVVAAGLLESSGHRLTFNYFFVRGFPVVLITLAVANVYLLIFHVAIPWY